MPDTRLERLVDQISLHNLDAVALNPGPSLTYLTGLHFHLMERPTVLLVAPGKNPALILPELEAAKTAHLDFPLSTFPYGENPGTWPDVFKRAAESLGLPGKIIGVEPTRFRFLELNLLQSALPDLRFTSAQQVMDSLRMIKDPGEVELMHQAVRIAQQAYLNTLPVIHPGVTEHEIAAELSIQLLRAGSDSEFPFSPIIASGPNSANPHAIPTDRQVQPGDLIVIDWGATYQGYISDLTRTVAVGQPEPEFVKISEIVFQANQAGRAAAQPEVPAGTVDQAARAVIDLAGYGQYFRHRTGHGIGMEGHEPPYIYAENDLILAAGMSFTVEPGIYLLGRGGVRIEDNVVITVDGCEVLSDLPRQLQIL